MFNRLPKTRQSFDPFNRANKTDLSEKKFVIRRKSANPKRSGSSLVKLALMVGAISWFLYYLASSRGGN